MVSVETSDPWWGGVCVCAEVFPLGASKMWSPHPIIPHINSLPQTQEGSKKDPDHLPNEFIVLGMEGDGVWILSVV